MKIWGLFSNRQFSEVIVKHLNSENYSQLTHHLKRYGLRIFGAKH